MFFSAAFGFALSAKMKSSEMLFRVSEAHSASKSKNVLAKLSTFCFDLRAWPAPDGRLLLVLSRAN
jgi:hypothetical protein